MSSRSRIADLLADVCAVVLITLALILAGVILTEWMVK